MARAHQERLQVIQQESRSLKTYKVFTQTNVRNNLLQNNYSQCSVWYFSLGVLFTSLDG